MKKIALILIALIGISTSSYSQDKNAKRVRNYIENNKRKVILKESAVKLRPDRAFSQRLAPGGINVRGNMTFVANSIVNREYATTYTRSSGRIWIWNATCRFWYRDYTYTVSGNSLNANDSFPDTQTLYALTSTDSCGINYYSDINSLNNGQQNMQYIDIDDADGITGSGSTFSSSKSTLALPNCSKVVYAGLYWAAIYPYETWEGQEVRDSNFNTIKFKLPEGNYENITGEVIYDDGSATQKPYVCYKNITTEVAAQTNANGEYYAADIKAVTGNDSNGLGGAGGWTMVVIYENQNESSKNISIFDGFVTIDGSTNVDVTYSGFTTIPAGPVRAEFIVGTLEGDGGLGGDRFQIMDNSTPTPVPVDISNAVNPVDNFFNGSISRNGTLTTTRTPASANTLGFDVDILSISNPSNSIIGNGDTSADVRFTTSRDVYWPFLNAMSIEIIQPEIQMVKRVEDALGNDIAGTSLALGAELWYDVSFQNVGTDNALNTVFVDELPKNVDLIETDIILPSGIDRNDPSQFQYEPPSSGNGFRGKITINIPDDMVEEGGLEYHIRFKVQVVTDCNQLRDVCSNRIENQAYVNYEGDRGGAPRKTVKSYASFDACSFGVVGTSNFLVDTSGCKYERNEILCGANLTLTAGSGFAAYEWSDASGIIGSTQSIVVTTPGVYTVKTTATAGCIDTTEIITVIPYTSEPNPLIPFADRMLTCTNKDIDLAEIFLCGASGSRDINLPFDPASGTTVQWSKLDETSCSDVTAAGCPNEQSGCIWNPIGTAFTQNISDEGEYKVDVLYDGRCLTTYYFNVFKSILTPDIIKKDITCGNDGQIIINGIPAGYQYRLTGPSGYDVGFQNSNTFSALTNPGDYNLQIRINNPTAASCTYDFGPINIQDNDIDIDLIPTHIVCSGDIGKIRIQVNNVPGDYTYTLLQGGVVVGTPQGPISTNDYTFDVSTGGTYEVRVTTDDCSITENVIINQATDLTLTAATTKNISCTSGSSDGIITLTGNGGTLTSGSQYNYAVWTDKGTDLYTAISDIPASAYFTSNTYTVTNGDEGTYRFVIIDSNNCYTISNPVTVSVETPLTFNHSSTDISCTGQVDGSINVSVNGSNQGYLVEYSIDGGVNWDVSGNFPGLAVNTYTIDIRASKPSYLCTYSITNIQIQDKAPIVSSASLTQDFTCTTLGQITFTAATGGTLDYSYGINGVYNSDLEYNNLPVGTYALTVRDSENCEVTLPSIEIKPLPVIPNIPSSITYNCDGNGNITLTPPSTPALTYSYSLDGGIPQPGNVFNSVGAGPHTITVTAPRACPRNFLVNVAPNEEFRGNILGSTRNYCEMGGSGTITIFASNFDGGEYEYSIDGGTVWKIANTANFVITGLAAGNYTVLLRDQSCEINIGTETILDIEPLQVTASITKDPTCAATNGGATITAIGQGGIPPYKYSLDGITWQDENVFLDLAAGTPSTDYTIHIQDSRNCAECFFETALTGCNDPVINDTTTINDLFLISGDALMIDQHTARITRAVNGRRGYVMSRNRISFAESFSLSFQAYLGTKNGNGADGIAFIFHNDPRGEASVGTHGEGLGALGIQNGLALELDTWNNGAGKGDIPQDHGSIWNTENRNILSNAVALPNLENGNWHNVELSWNVFTNTLSYTVNGTLAGSITDTNLVNTYFNGSDEIFLGFSAATGGSNNLQQIRFNDFCSDIPYCPTRCNAICVATNISNVVTVTAPAEVLHSVNATDCYDRSNGQIEVTVTQGVSNYLFRINSGPWVTPTPANSATHTFTGLIAGSYDIEVQDALGCISTLSSHRINSQLTGTVVPTDANCGVDSGRIEVNAVGGTGTGYTYAIVADGVVPAVGDYVGSNSLNVSAGTYDVYVLDSAGCPLILQDIVINQIANPTASTTVRQPLCSSDNGSFSLTIGGGQGPYDITIVGSVGATPIAPQLGVLLASSPINYPNLAPGTYDITVRDSNNCPITTQAIITAPTAITGANPVATDLECSPTGVTQGTITFTEPTGGTGTGTYTYFYGIDGSGVFASTTSTTVSGLPSGIYDVKVEDGNGCELIYTDVVIDALPTEPTLNESVVYNCNGTANVTITAVPLPAGVTYTVSPGGISNTTGIFPNLAVGDYTVEVDYGRNCTKDIAVRVEANKELGGSSLGTPVTCNGGSDGTIEIKVDNLTSTAAGTYEYSIDGGTTWLPLGGAGTNVTPFTVTNLTAGTYNVEVRETGNTSCEVSAGTVVITQPDPVVVTGVNLLKGVTCAPATGATLDPSATGGNGAAYTYALYDNATATGVPLQTTVPFTNVAGTVGGSSYWVVATDVSGVCSSVPFEVVVTSPTPLSVVAVGTNCYNGTNGEVAITITGGELPYLVSINGGTAVSINTLTHTFTGLGAQNHVVNITDNNGCSATANDDVNPQLTGTVVPTDANCGVDSGRIEVNAVGGTGTGYTYAIVADGVVPAVGDYVGSNSLNVSAGTYDVYVLDSAGCPLILQDIVINQIANPTASTTVRQPLCSSDNGSFSLTIGGGQGPYDITIVGSVGATPIAPQLGVLLASSPINYPNLAPGTYDITVRDSNNCPITTQAIITAPTAITGANPVATDLECSPTGVTQGTITFTEPTGGTGTGTYTYFYGIDGSGVFASTTSTTVSGLPSGIYDVKVEDGNGCELIYTDVVIDALPTEPTLNESVVYNCNGTANVTITAVPLPAGVTYTVSPGGISNTTGIFPNLAVGDYTVEVDYGRNCTKDIAVRVEANKELGGSSLGTPVTCNGGSDGTIEIKVDNLTSTAAGTYEYSIDGGTTWLPLGGAGTNVTPFTVTNLTAGTYNVEVRETGNTSCEVSAGTVVITQPDPVVVTGVNLLKGVTCAPATGATLDPSATGGNGAAYTYALYDNATATGVPLQTTVPFTNVAGTVGGSSYWVVATDVSGVCSSVPFEVVVTSPTPLSVVAVGTNCYNGTNGEVAITITGGELPYLVSINGGTAVSINTLTHTFTGLGAQNHVVNITDNNGCSATANDDVNNELSATASSTDISCSTAGQILVNPIGGSGAGYQYSVVPDGMGAGTFSNVNPIAIPIANTYDIYVIDGDGCPFKIENVIVNSFTDPSMVITPNPELVCFGETSTVNVTISNGLPPYTVNITNGSTVDQTVVTNTNTVNFPGLLGDTYTVSLTDANGCIPTPATVDLSITELPEIDATVTGVVPTTCIPYVGNESQFGFDYDLPAALSALAAPYIVQVRDESGSWVNDDGINTFTSIPPNSIITPAVRIFNNITGVQVCFREFPDLETTYALSSLVIDITFDIINCQDGMDVEVQASGGTNTYAFALDDIPLTAAPLGWDAPDVVGGDTRTYSGLIPGRTYTFYVTDLVTNCIEQETRTFNPPTSSDTIPITSLVTTEGCGVASGAIDFTVDNSSGNATAASATWHVYEVGVPLSPTLSTNAIESGTVPAGANFIVSTTVPLAAGTYYLLIEEPGATPTCKWASGDVEIKNGTPITADLNVINSVITCSVDGIISVDNISGGFPGYTISTVSSYETGTPANVIPNTLTGNLVSVDFASLGGATSVTVDVIITDSRNCTETFSQVLTVNPVPSITSATGNSCSANKSIEIVVTGGTPPYKYSVDGGTNYSSATTATTYSVDGLTTAVYNSIQVEDSNGCIATFTTPVSLYDNLDFTTNLVTALDCIPNNGVYELSVTSGSGGDYTYDIQNSGLVSVDGGTILAGAVTKTANFDIPAGTPGIYSVIVTDVLSGCSITKTIDVAAAVIPTFTAVGVDAICDGDSNGRINITTTGGLIPVTYQAITNPGGVVTGTWDSAASAITGLPAGTYDVIGTATNGCLSAPTTITIDDYDPIVVPILSVNDFSCASGNVTTNATLVFNSGGVTGGSGSYTVELYKVASGGDVKITSGLSVTGAGVAETYTYTITDESGGDYYIRIVDNKGCTNVSTTETLPAFERITDITASQVTALDCNNEEDISIIFNSTNPTTGATITIVGDVTGSGYAAVTPVNSGVAIPVGYSLPADTYTITVTHPTTGCALSTRYTVAEPVDHIVNVTPVSSVSCFGGNNGEVSFIVDSSTPYIGPYTYQVLTSPGLVPVLGGSGVGNVTQNVAGLSAGNYIIRLTMTATPDCVRDSAEFTIAGPSGGLTVVPTLNPISCINGSDGSISVFASNGWGDYRYRLIRGTILAPGVEVAPYSPDNLFQNLNSDDYVIQVRDSEGCIVETEVNLANPSQVGFSLVINHNACVAAAGVIEVNATGGTGSYKYTLLDAAGTTELRSQLDPNNEFVGLAAGTYTVQVEDDKGCGAVATQTATIHSDLDFTTNLVTALDCIPNNGVYELSVTSGSGGDYTYDIQNSGLVSVDGGTILAGAVTKTANFDIPAGTPGIYSVIVTDVLSGCSITKTIDVAAAVIPTFTAVGVDAICDGDSNGRINITTTGGLIPVTYQAITNPGGVVTGTWDSAASAITGLPAGTYDVIGTATNGCLSAPTTITIDDYDPIVVPILSVNDFSCASGNVTTNATLVFNSGGVTGGSGSYTVELYKVASGGDVKITSGLSVTGAGVAETYTYTITDESGGDYYIRIVDNKGCTNVSATETLPAFERITDITASQVTALDCNNEEDISIIFNSTNPITGATITIVGDVTGSGYAAVTPVNSGVAIPVGYSLPADTYTITVTHPTTGCTLSTRYTVAEPVDHIVNVTPVSSVSCFGGNNGEVSFIVDSSTPYTGPYTYQVLTSPGLVVVPGLGGSGVGNVTQNVAGLSAGNYIIRLTMTATPDCVRDSAEFTIAGPSGGLTVVPTLNPISCINGSDGSISVFASNGWGDYRYRLIRGTILVPGVEVAPYSPNNLFQNLNSDDYVIQVRDSEGCVVETEVNLANPSQVGFSLVINHNACVAAGGVIEVNATGGTGSYKYTLLDAAGTTELRSQLDPNNEFVGLAAGTYTVQVEDDKGCGAVATQIATIHSDLDFTTNLVTALDCIPNNGVYELSVISGSGGDYTYDIQNSGLVSVDGGTILAGAVTKTANFDIPAGTPGIYSVIVTDVLSGCSITKTIDVAAAVIPTFTAVGVDAICDGDSNGRINITAPSGMIPVTYQAITNPGGVVTGTWDSATSAITGLPAGTYDVIGTATNGCLSPATTITIDDYDPIVVPILSVNDFSCASGNATTNATLVFNSGGVTGGSGSYTVELYKVASGGDVKITSGLSVTGAGVAETYTYTITDESGGDYYIRIVDNKGCTNVSATETLPAFERITDITASQVTALDCNNEEDISIIFNSTNPITGATITIVGDVTGSGYAAVTPVNSGVAIPVGYSLPADTYTITVTHPTTGCTLSTRYTVAEPVDHIVNVTPVSSVSCFGGNNGEVSFIVDSSTPYTGPYTYQVLTSPGLVVVPGLGGSGVGNVTQNVAGLSAGNYIIRLTMTATPDCVRDSAEFTIAGPGSDLALTATPTLISCVGPSTGEVMLNATGGWGNFEYELVNTTTGQVKQSFNRNAVIVGLDAGRYSATVRDLNNCTETIMFELFDPTPITANYSVVNNLCNGEQTATISMSNATGGQGTIASYTYTLTYPDGTVSANQSSTLFENLKAGDYQVIVYDEYSCQSLPIDVQIIDPIKVVASASVTNAITCDRNLASVVVSGQGGTAPYTYSIDGVNFINTNIFGVAGGKHKFYVRDSFGCTSEPFTLVTVDPYDELVSSLRVVSGFVTCNGDNNGVLSAITKGGLGNYEYELLDASNTILRPKQPSNMFSGLVAGNYKIRVFSTNAAGDECQIDTGLYEIKEPDVIQLSETHTNLNCNGGKDGTITVNALGGNLGYEYNISSDPPNKFVKTNVFENLAAGIYTITVKDKVGCYDTIQVEIAEPSAIALREIGVTQQVCLSDPSPVIRIEATGGAISPGSATYIVSINGIDLPGIYNEGIIVLGAAEGIEGNKRYIISVRDSSDLCSAESLPLIQTVKPIDLQLELNFEYTCPLGNVLTATVQDEYKNAVVYSLLDSGALVSSNDTGIFTNIPPSTNYTVTVEHVVSSCPVTVDAVDVLDIQELKLAIDDSQKNKLIANASFGLPPYFFSIDDGEFTSENEFTIFETREYKIQVKDSRGCITELTIEGVYITIDVPNIFTPDGDGVNDYWYPLEVETYHDLKVFIYDRYARKIQTFNGVQAQGWDGTYDGKELPSGDYWYTIYFKELSGQERKIMGHFTLYR